MTLQLTSTGNLKSESPDPHSLQKDETLHSKHWETFLRNEMKCEVNISTVIYPESHIVGMLGGMELYISKKLVSRKK